LKKAFAVEVEKETVQHALQCLRRLRLLDNSLALTRSGKKIALPLLRRPTDEETSMLSENCRGASYAEELFPELERKPISIREILADRLPRGTFSEIPRSFDVIGDVAVIELPESLEQFYSVVGDAVLQVNPEIRLVLRKAGETKGRFRTRVFQIIAGSGNTETTHREFACTFRLDVEKVYFNPRLSHERKRVANAVREGEHVVDMFAGVGPYSVLIARSHPTVTVYSIDINPDAYRYLAENAFLNQVADRVIPILGDAKELARGRLRGVADRVVMNFPSGARDFLADAALMLKRDGGWIHYYTFASRDDSLECVKTSFQDGIEAASRRINSFSHVKVLKEVSPSKVQVVLDAQIG